MTVNAMYRNMPAVKPTIHLMASSSEEAASPTYSPIIHVRAEIKFHSKAFLLDMPALIRTAKSPEIKSHFKCVFVVIISLKLTMYIVQFQYEVLYWSLYEIWKVYHMCVDSFLAGNRENSAICELPLFILLTCFSKYLHEFHSHVEYTFLAFPKMLKDC